MKMRTWTSVFILTMSALNVHGCKVKSIELNRCLHVFLERDFLSMEMIVFPKFSPHNDVNRCKAPYKDRVTLEGPSLEDNCKKIRQVLDCFTDVLKSCEYLEDFFQYRQLIESLEKVYDWVCGDVTKLRERLGDLEKHYECIESLISKNCEVENVGKNIWNKILRLEEDKSVCSKLQQQQNCALQNKVLVRHSPDAHNLYNNMTSIFLDSWCSSAPIFTYSNTFIGVFVLTLYFLFFN